MVSLHPCSGCKFFYGEYEVNRCCNYIFVVGKRRPCPPGEFCTVKETIAEGLVSYRRSAQEKAVSVKMEKTCFLCGKEFYTTNIKRRYCCDLCKERARRYRRRTKKEERL